MTIRNLESLFEPGSVALIGATADEGKLGHIVARNLLTAGFAGPVWFVNPNRRRVLDQTVYASVADLPGTPDLAVIATPPETVPGIVDELGRVGTRAAIVVSTRFPDGDDEGATLRQQMLDASRPWLLRLLGPSSLGIAVPGIGLNASFGHLNPRPGELAFVAQSGTVVSSVVDWTQAWNIGFSHLVSLGDAADVDCGDLLDYLADRKETGAILLYVERVASPRKFMSAARAAARMKPVVVVKAGRRPGPASPPVRATEAGMVVDPDAVFGAAFRRAGLLRVDELGELFGAAEILGRFQKVRGEQACIVTNSGGIALMATDELAARRGRLAQLSPDSARALAETLTATGSELNPIDLGGDADVGRYSRALEIVLADPAVDATLVLHCPTAVTAGEDLAAWLAGSREPTNPPMLLTSFVGETSVGEARAICAEAGIPSFGTPEEAVQGLMYLVNHRRNQLALMETPPSIPRLFVQDMDEARRIIDGVLADGRQWLDAAEARSLLRAYGVPVATGAAADGDREPAAGALELLVGAAVDGVFGPVIVFGRGGVAAELTPDVAIGLPPMNMRLARDMMERTQVYRQLTDERNEAGADPEALGLVILQVAQLVSDFAEIVDLEINPLLAAGDTVTALDARVRVIAADRPAGDRLAILPYPKTLEEEFTLADGRTFLLRPIVPEDEPALLEAFDELTQEEIRLRFHSPIKVLTHMMAARFTQLDYDREMALVLTEPGTPGKTPVYGVVRLHIDPDHEHGDFAILVQHSMTGHGLGTHMMERIIDYARQRGLKEIGGDVLNENKVMLGLARKLGFKVKHKLEDRGVRRVVLEL